MLRQCRNMDNDIFHLGEGGEESVLCQVWKRESPVVWVKGRISATLNSYGKFALSWFFHLPFTLLSLVVGPHRHRHKSCPGSFELPHYLLLTPSDAKTWPILLTGMRHTETVLVSFQWWVWLFHSFIHHSSNKCCKFAHLPKGVHAG